MANTNIGRRDFIKKAAFATAGGLLAKPGEVSAKQNKPVYKVEVETPNMKRDWSKAKYDWVDKKWNSLKIDFIEWLLYLETFEEVPARHGDGMWTTGAGLTWEETATYAADDKTKIAEITKKRTRSINTTIKGRHLAAYKPQKVPKTSKEWEDFVKLHMFAETLNSLYDKLKAKDMLDISDEKLIGLVGMRWLGTYGINNAIDKLQTAKTKQAIVNAYYTVIPKNGGATKRSYACGLMAAGFISKDEVLKLSQDGWSVMATKSYTKYDKNGKFSNFDISKSTRTTFLEKEKLKTVNHYRNAYFKDLSKSTRQSQSIQEEVADNESMRLTLEGLGKFKQGKYADAEKLYIQALKKDSSNIEAIADLGFVYLKLGNEMLKAGKTKEATDYYEKSASFALKARDAASSDQDEEFVANAYFNAGMARKAIGEIYVSQDKKNEAKEQYTKAKINFKNANRFNPKEVYRKREEEMDSELENLGISAPVPTPGKNLLEEAKDLYAGGEYEDIVRKLTNKIGRSGLDSASRALLWYILADALRREAVTQKKPDWYRQAYNAYSEVEKTDPGSEYAKSAEVQKEILKDNGRVEIQSNGRAKGLEEYDPLPEDDEWLKEKIMGMPSSGRRWGLGFGIGAAVVTAAAAIGLNEFRKRKNKVAEEKNSR